MPNDSTIELGDEPVDVREVPLEEKYRVQMRQIIAQKIELPISTLPGMIEDQIDLNPEFQRRDRWDPPRRSRFIESIIMNVPIPPVFLGESEYGKYVVLDGRQRLTAVYEYLRNTYPLSKLEVWDELNGATYRELEKRKLDKIITRRFIPAVVILKESSPEVKYDVFDRLNTGGMIAEPMEIRNAVFPGLFTKLLHKLSADENFRRLWGIPTTSPALEQDTLYSKMTDLELVLRFFALRDYTGMNLAFKDYLSDFLAERNRLYKQDPHLEQSDERQFRAAARNAWSVFGADAFKKLLPDRRSPFKSAPLADAVMIILAEVRPDLITPETAAALRQKFDDLCLNNAEFRKAISTGTNGKGAIASRIEIAKAAVAEVL